MLTFERTYRYVTKDPSDTRMIITYRARIDTDMLVDEREFDVFEDEYKPHAYYMWTAWKTSAIRRHYALTDPIQHDLGEVDGMRVYAELNPPLYIAYHVKKHGERYAICAKPDLEDVAELVEQYRQKQGG